MALRFAKSEDSGVISYTDLLVSLTFIALKEGVAKQLNSFGWVDRSRTEAARKVSVW